jgi:hypothetical protein
LKGCDPLCLLGIVIRNEVQSSVLVGDKNRVLAWGHRDGFLDAGASNIEFPLQLPKFVAKILELGFIQKSVTFLPGMCLETLFDDEAFHG